LKSHRPIGGELLILVSHTVNWTQHVSDLGDKLSRVNGILSKLKNVIPSSILLTIYTSLFQSHLNYGITCWGYNYGSRILKLQKRAIRNVAKAKYNAHTDPLFKSLKILKLDDIFKLTNMKLYHKFHNNNLPAYFSDLPFNLARANPEETGGRPRRDIHLTERYAGSQTYLPTINPIIQVVATEKNLSRNCIRHFIPKLINEGYLPNIALTKVSSHSLKGFNLYAKNVILNYYKDLCTIENCYICSRAN